MKDEPEVDAPVEFDTPSAEESLEIGPSESMTVPLGDKVMGRVGERKLFELEGYALDDK